MAIQLYKVDYFLTSKKFYAPAESRAMGNKPSERPNLSASSLAFNHSQWWKLAMHNPVHGAEMHLSTAKATWQPIHCIGMTKDGRGYKSWGKREQHSRRIDPSDKCAMSELPYIHQRLIFLGSKQDARKKKGNIPALQASVINSGPVGE